jgi:uncharacterized peroxidase-related enzyme
MPQPDHVHVLPLPEESALDEEMRAYFDLCREKLGFVPNVLRAYSFRPKRLENFVAFHDELMRGNDSPLSRLEREMIAVVVSSCNHCYYCLVAHGQAVRRLSEDPELGEMLAMDYRVAPLEPRHRAMLDYAWKLTERPHEIGDADRTALREVGFGDEAIWDITETAAFFNYTNRMAHGLDFMPNPEYHRMDR